MNSKREKIKALAYKIRELSGIKERVIHFKDVDEKMITNPSAIMIYNLCCELNDEGIDELYIEAVKNIPKVNKVVSLEEYYSINKEALGLKLKIEEEEEYQKAFGKMYLTLEEDEKGWIITGRTKDKRHNSITIQDMIYLPFNVRYPISKITYFIKFFRITEHKQGIYSVVFLKNTKYFRVGFGYRLPILLKLFQYFGLRYTGVYKWVYEYTGLKPKEVKAFRKILDTYCVVHTRKNLKGEVD